jgi:hypothetical protein
LRTRLIGNPAVLLQFRQDAKVKTVELFDLHYFVPRRGERCLGCAHDDDM